MNKKYFITFSAGNTNYYDASDRLIKQANNLCIFDKIISYTDDYLKMTMYFGPNTKILLKIIQEDMVIGYGNHI